MTRLASLALVAAVSMTLANTADAGGCRGRVITPKPIIHPPVVHPPVIQPITWPTPAPTARAWYFGMSLQITNTHYGKGLQVASVTPGSPAQRAGLEPGDVLLASSVRSFASAYSNEHGVDLLHQSVLGGGGGAPAPAVTTVSTFVAPVQSGYADLQVLDVRTGGVTNLRVFPQHVGGGFPAPAQAAPAPAAAF